MTNIDYRRGKAVRVDGKQWVILEVVDLNTLVGEDRESGEKRLIEIKDIEGPVLDTSPQADLLTISEKSWAVANQRFEVIKPLLNDSDRTVKNVDAAAKAIGASRPTIYRWIERFQTTGTVQSLVPGLRGGAGQRRLDAGVEALIEEVIQNTWLHKQKVNAQIVIERIQSECRKKGLSCPHPNTIRKRLHAIPAKIRVKRREGRKAAQQYEQAAGTHDEADFPLQVVKIDHTILDIEIVDNEHRLSIGRPWITIAIDVYSRVVTGFVVSLEPPSALSVGLVISHSVNRKDEWLVERDIQAEWPVWGIPTAIFVDNAGEFRGEVVTRACQNYGIDLNWNPVARPKFGAHIERLIGTINVKLSSLPGRTGNSPKARGDYDSSKQAALTLGELEQYLGTYFCEIYHRRMHKSLSKPPLKAYADGIQGTPEKIGRGLPLMPADPKRFSIDFLPFYQRAVQPKGIVINNVYYYAHGLRKWINASEGATSKKRKFIIRRDPRSISKAWFLDPDTNEYIELSYSNLTFPDVSEWELDAARKRLIAEGRKSIDQDALFASIDKLRALEEQATANTRAARRKNERRKTGSSLISEERPVKASQPADSSLYEAPKIEVDDTYEPVEPLDFEDLDV